MAFPFAHLPHLNMDRHQSWPDYTPETARDLVWSSPIDPRSPESMKKWEVSPLRGSPARRLFSWPDWSQLEDASSPIDQTAGEKLVFIIEDVSLEEAANEEVFLLKDLD